MAALPIDHPLARLPGEVPRTLAVTDLRHEGFILVRQPGLRPGLAARRSRPARRRALARRADPHPAGPYKGGGQQLADALAGHFELLSTNVAVAQRQYIRCGGLKALAVGAPQRLASLPEVPTWAELGYPLANLASVSGLMAPAGGGTEQLAQMIHAEHEQHRVLLQRAPMRLE